MKEGGEVVWINRWVTNLSKDRLRLKEEIRLKIQNLTLKEIVSDKWIWAKNVYTVKEAYTTIVDGSLNRDNKERKLADVWSKVVPLEMLVLV